MKDYILLRVERIKLFISNNIFDTSHCSLHFIIKRDILVSKVKIMKWMFCMSQYEHRTHSSCTLK